ncbi:ester cyclase [Rhodococcus sp. W8901]|uniref:ester cyclase n=1 Tax=Rhodococcus sp. W8901 TaxID=2742603 RepID=UPI0034A0C133
MPTRSSCGSRSARGLCEEQIHDGHPRFCGPRGRGQLPVRGGCRQSSTRSGACCVPSADENPPDGCSGSGPPPAGRRPRRGPKPDSRATFVATHTGEFLGIPATGRRIEFDEVLIMRVSAGRITEVWALADELSLLEQLGAVVQGARRRLLATLSPVGNPPWPTTSGGACPGPETRNGAHSRRSGRH